MGVDVTSIDHPTRILSALRDFFVAPHAEALEKAYRSLAMAFPRVVHEKDDWGVLAFAFNRLFVGPGPVVAPPFASVYLDDEPFVMGKTTLKVRQIYEMVGLRSPWHGAVPDDHIALELDACLHMHLNLQKRPSSQLEALYAYFITEHMMQWVPQFIDKVTHEEDVPEPILWVCRRLSHWLVFTYQQLANRSEKGINPDTKKGEVTYGKMEP